MQLSDCDIKTREVLEWEGLHLFHSQLSSCSQKVRIYLNIKGISWTPHPINVAGNENISEYYLGINPRGLVPCLIHDGAVHIESNDILTHLEACFPEPALIPPEHRDSIETLLRHENDLHLALRTVSFRFMMPLDKPPKAAEDLENYATRGSGTVGGVVDPAKVREIEFWRNMLDGGISDDAARKAVAEFREALTDLDARLAEAPHILGDALSVLDIAWVIYVNRLQLAGYPVARLHPHVGAWAERLRAHPAFTAELSPPAALLERITAHQAKLAQAGQSLCDVCGLA